MTEPIKLPPLPEPWNFTRPTVEAYAALAVEQATAGLRAMLDRAIERLHAAEAALQPVKDERDEARAELARLTTQRLWVWRNFSATKRELWVFDNPFPVYMDSGDPQTIGEPYGYALFKPSRRGRADITDEQAMEQMMRTPLPDVKEAKP